jgi:hypothetical protein
MLLNFELQRLASFGEFIETQKISFGGNTLRNVHQVFVVSLHGLLPILTVAGSATLHMCL